MVVVSKCLAKLHVVYAYIRMSTHTNTRTYMDTDTVTHAQAHTYTNTYADL